MIRFSFNTTLAPAEVLILPFFEDQDFKKNIKAVSSLNLESVLSLLLTPDFEGKFLQMQFCYTGETELPRILLLGLGKKSECTIRKFKQALGSAVIACQKKKIAHVAYLCGDESLQDAALAVEIAAYSYDEHKNPETRVFPIESFQFVSLDVKKNKKEMKSQIDAGIIIGSSINWTRTLANTPPSIMTPMLLASEAQTLSQLSKDIKVKILSQKEIEKLKMGCLLGVASGSQHEPKFIIVEYSGGKPKEAPTVFVGKGITFDSGGLSLKPADALIDMKYDMLGGATVLGILRAAAQLKLKKNIVALVPTCENMPSGSSYRPDDILTAMNGKTVLVENTDAEGRLILADGLCYAAKYNPKEVIDLATLTGHCCYALGNERSGLFTQDENLAQGLQKSSTQVGEQLWRLPLGEEFSEAIKCEVADIRNLGGVGSPRFGGASTAAAFLENFTSYPWAHIDMSCSHYSGKGKSWIRGGANGFGIETMIEYLKG
jgi:leucyl aminopeptidase